MATKRRPAPRPSRADAAKPPVDQPTFGGPHHERLAALPGQYFVRVHPAPIRERVPVRARAAVGSARVTFGAATAEAVPEAVVEPLEYLRANTGLKNVRPLFADAG